MDALIAHLGARHRHRESAEPASSQTAYQRRHPILIERAERLERLVSRVLECEEIAPLACNRLAAKIATQYIDAWAVDDIDAGRLAAAEVLLQPPNERQADLAAEIAYDLIGDQIDPATRELAASAIRACPQRNTRMPEALVLAEVVNLDSIGPMWLVAQISRCAAEGKPIESIFSLWRRQSDYNYWHQRIDETLRFAASRDIARKRVAGLTRYMAALESQLIGGDTFPPEPHD